MNIKKKIKGIEFKTIIYILVFNISIILIMWICEAFVFNAVYKTNQIKKINNIVTELNNSEKNIYTLAENLAYDNEVCISIIDEDNAIINFNTLQPGCLLNKNNKTIRNYVKAFLTSNNVSNYYKIDNPITNTKSILYAVKNNNKNILVFSNLENVSNFFKLFRVQNTYFIILIMLCSIIISIFIASITTKPVREITKKAKDIGKGKYNIKFPKNGINEIDELSETLEEVQKELRASDEVKRDLLANVSHDLKTPLTMIKAYAEMIKDISYKDTKKMNEHLDIIMEESDRLTNLVNDILELSKMQNESLIYNYEEYDLVKEIKNIVKKFEVIEYLEKYKFVLELPKKAIVKADKEKINQVIYNLLNNAINFTGDDKVVTIKLTKEKEDYLVEIKDTGKGIKEEELPYIWDKYYKNDKNHQRSVTSTGLGLSIVKEILNKHNFSYGVKSKVGSGSTFYFKISSI